jgi:pimeloyl-ACP methyl ester carboxylesterase
MTAALSPTENLTASARHTTFYLAAGPAQGTPIILLHGWPDLSISWCDQLPVLAGLGFRAVAPDMRGYGRSSIYARHADYALEQVVADMIELIDALGAEKAVWVGHDWGAPVVWSLAQHHSERCHGVAALGVPYLPLGFTAEHAVATANRSIYPQERFPAAQWDYQFFYHEHFDAACAAFQKNVRATVRVLFRSGNPAGKGRPARTSMVRANGGWFGAGVGAPDVPRDTHTLTEEAENSYVAALERNGFFGPNSWYMNDAANAAYAERARANWRLAMPVLFVHAVYDYVCETLDSRLAEPMRANCANLTEATVLSGHWMAREQPTAVNIALVKWLVLKLPQLMEGPGTSAG